MAVCLTILTLSILIPIMKHFSASICSFLYSALGSKMAKVFETVQASEERSHLDELLREEPIVRQEIITLKAEQSKLSQIDHFAAYAKIDRKLIKLNDKLEKIIIAKKTSKQNLRRLIKYTFNVLLAFFTIVFIWSFKQVPIYKFVERDMDNERKASIFFPLDFIVAFPSFSAVNTISVTFWLFIVNRFFSIVINKLKTN